VTNGIYTAAYSYLANSPLVSQIVFKENATTRMTTTKQYDLLNRLTTIASTTNSSTVPAVSFASAYNNSNQRRRASLVDGSFWVYDYDTLGQVLYKKGTPPAASVPVQAGTERN
jgi:hypothetical protein